MGEGTCSVGPIRIGKIASLSIGSNAWIGHHLCIEGNGTVSIGNDVDVAPCCTFATGGHLIGDSGRRAGKEVSFRQELLDGCRIGIRSTFVNDVVLGRGCVVASGAVVTCSVPDGKLVGGVPARILRELNELRTCD